LREPTFHLPDPRTPHSQRLGDLADVLREDGRKRQAEILDDASDEIVRLEAEIARILAAAQSAVDAWLDSDLSNGPVAARLRELAVLLGGSNSGGKINGSD
jgi:hypothetical protein